MGSFAGHIDEAIFFLLLGVWWMFNMFPNHIRSRWMRRDYEGRLSYPLPCKPRVPVEAIMKTLFPLGGFIAELWAAHNTFIDSHGNFKHLVMMQHMTIYGIFILHGIIDILMSCRVPLPKGLDYLTMAGALAWYAIAFKFHAHMEGKEPLEAMVHILPIYILFAAAIAVLVEYWKPDNFMATLSRLYCVLVMGTWFVHVSTILYLPTPFPGPRHNPAWNQSDPRNVHALVAIFGFHCNLHIVVIPVVYLCVYAYLKWKGEDRSKFQPLMNNIESENEECGNCTCDTSVC